MAKRTKVDNAGSSILFKNGQVAGKLSNCPPQSCTFPPPPPPPSTRHPLRASVCESVYQFPCDMQRRLAPNG